MVFTFATITTGGLFNIRRFAAKSKKFLAMVLDVLDADDCDLVAHSVQGMQILMDRLSKCCRTFGLSIKHNNTVVIFQHAQGLPYTETSIFVD